MFWGAQVRAPLTGQNTARLVQVKLAVGANNDCMSKYLAGPLSPHCVSSCALQRRSAITISIRERRGRPRQPLAGRVRPGQGHTSSLRTLVRDGSAWGRCGQRRARVGGRVLSRGEPLYSWMGPSDRTGSAFRRSADDRDRPAAPVTVLKRSGEPRLVDGELAGVRRRAAGRRDTAREAGSKTSETPPPSLPPRPPAPFGVARERPPSRGPAAAMQFSLTPHPRRNEFLGPSVHGLKEEGGEASREMLAMS